MHILRVEHPVQDYERWKASFDEDPIGRTRSGLQRFRVMRTVDDPAYVLIDLEFADVAAASSTLEALQELWGRASVMRDPQARIVELVEAAELAADVTRYAPGTVPKSRVRDAVAISKLNRSPIDGGGSHG